MFCLEEGPKCCDRVCVQDVLYPETCIAVRSEVERLRVGPCRPGLDCERAGSVRRCCSDVGG